MSPIQVFQLLITSLILKQLQNQAAAISLAKPTVYNQCSSDKLMGTCVEAMLRCTEMQAMLRCTEMHCPEQTYEVVVQMTHILTEASHFGAKQRTAAPAIAIRIGRPKPRSSRVHCASC